MLKPEFIEMLDALSAIEGGDVVNGLADALATSEPAIGMRLNSLKLHPLVAHDLRPVPWSIDGFYIDGERPRFTLDPALHQGLYYVQDPSSMIISSIVKQLAGDTPIAYLDACAAPGGKTTAATAVLPAGSLVVANEYDRRRAEVLRENVVKWGYEASVVTRGDTAAFASLPGFFDIVAVDAPCSGEGMMRKEAVAVDQWSPALVSQCANLQREILDNCWATLRPGGYLIYSTCTFNRSEDEENLLYIASTLGGEPVAVDYPQGCGIAGAIGSTLPALRFIPGRVEGEGLFIGVMRKPGTPFPSPNAAIPKEKPLKSDLPATLLNPGDYIYEETSQGVTAIPRRWYAEISRLRRSLNVIHAGVEMATVKGRDLVPTQSLAMSRALDPASIPSAEVDYPTAIAYLRGEAVRLDDAPRGFILLTYRHYPLGFAKNIGNRANNLYPSPWTIKTTYTFSTPDPNFPLQ